MPSETIAKVAIWLIGLIFGAAVALTTMRLTIAQAKKDVNAIGAIVRRDRWNLLLALMVITEEREGRQRLADLMRQQ